MIDNKVINFITATIDNTEPPGESDSSLLATFDSLPVSWSGPFMQKILQFDWLGQLS